MKALLRNLNNASNMEHMTLKRLPVGIQTYSKLVEQDCLYIDKTEYIWKMMKVSNYIFLSRPRRFGKSLLVSTLQAYFQRTLHRQGGEGVDGIPRAEIQHGFGQAHGKGPAGKVSSESAEGE